MYCNYSKDKFNNDITFIKPSWLECTYEDIPMESELCYLSRQYQDDTNNRFIASLVESKYAYMSLLQKGWTPQQARAILPNSLKTELVMTGFIDDWKHFLSLRSSDYGATGAHPDASYLANMLYAKLREKNYIS
jgi:thymidylate synthase (FAD)